MYSFSVYDSNAATYSGLKYLITNLTISNDYQKQRDRIAFYGGDSLELMTTLIEPYPNSFFFRQPFVET
jgi:hypothetical protein